MNIMLRPLYLTNVSLIYYHRLVFTYRTAMNQNNNFVFAHAGLTKYTSPYATHWENIWAMPDSRTNLEFQQLQYFLPHLLRRLSTGNTDIFSLCDDATANIIT